MQRKKTFNLLLISLFFSDIFFGVLAFFCAYYLRNVGIFRIYLESVQPIEVYLLALPFALLLCFLIFHSHGLYEPRQRINTFTETYVSIKAITLFILLIMAGSYLLKYDYSRVIILLFYIFLLIGILFGRYLIRRLYLVFSPRGFGRTNIAIIGDGKPAREIARYIDGYRNAGMYFVGFISADELDKKKHIGAMKNLTTLIKKYSIHEIYIAEPQLSYEKILSIIAHSNHVKFKIAANMFSLITGNVNINKLENIPGIDVNRTYFPLWKRLYKRMFDIVFALDCLILSIPFWIFIAIFIRLESRGNALFVQERVGRNGKKFRMYKFRTMLMQKKDAQQQEITGVGYFLRRTSLDELPQLLNIIKGDMSFVGPRPELPHIVKKYTYWQKRRLLVKPGLTGLWQILGRKDLPLAENMEYDFYYINNQSLLLDLTIILKTIPIVLSRKGAY